MSTLRNAVEEYVTVRRGLGTQLRLPAAALRRFVDFLEHEKADFVTTELALRWAQQPPRCQPATWADRLGVVRRFAAWRSASDPRTQVPPQGLLPHRRRRMTPYIYSDQDIVQLLAEATRLPSSTGLRPLTYTTLFGLLAVTGLRPGEALALDVTDVDLLGSVLAVRKTKFGKSRFVPVHDSTRDALAHYAKHRDLLCPRRQTNAFFISELGTRLYQEIAAYTFAKVSRAIGLRAPSGQTKGPRAEAPGPTPPICHSQAYRLVPRRLRRGAGDAKAGHISWACPRTPHLLVYRSRSRAPPACYRAPLAASPGGETMTPASFPSLLQRFFTDRLLKQLSASSHTVASYRDTFRLLLRFAAERLGQNPSDLRMEELDEAFLGSFLDHLEHQRGSSVRTRNTRLAALHAFFRYVALSEPAYALNCQRALAIPAKRYVRASVEFLAQMEVEALLAAPDPTTWIDRKSVV